MRPIEETIKLFYDRRYEELSDQELDDLGEVLMNLISPQKKDLTHDMIRNIFGIYYM